MLYLAFPRIPSFRIRSDFFLMTVLAPKPWHVSNDAFCPRSPEAIAQRAQRFVTLSYRRPSHAVRWLTTALLMVLAAAAGAGAIPTYEYLRPRWKHVAAHVPSSLSAWAAASVSGLAGQLMTATPSVVRLPDKESPASIRESVPAQPEIALSSHAFPDGVSRPVTLGSTPVPDDAIREATRHLQMRIYAEAMPQVEQVVPADVPWPVVKYGVPAAPASGIESAAAAVVRPVEGTSSEEPGAGTSFVADDLSPAPRSAPSMSVMSEPLAADVMPVPGAVRQVHASSREPALYVDVTPGPDQWIDEAHARLEAGDHDAALGYFDRALADAPRNHAALEGKAFVLSRMGQYDDAVRAISRMLQYYPQDKSAKRNLVTMLGLSSRPDTLAELLKLSAANPDDPAIPAALARRYAKAGDVAGAREQLELAARRAPNDVGLVLDLATIYDRAGQSADALALYRRVLGGEAAGTLQLSAPSWSAIRQRAAYLEAQAPDKK